MKINIEVADTPDLLAHGLMHRQNLPSDSGMLFKFPSVREASFWGKNTYIPLDLAFIDHSGSISEIKSITPMSTKMIHSSGFCSMALETNAGFFQEHGIKPGDKINIKDSELEFIKC